MARLFQPPYTKPIPDGAEIVTHKGKPHARYKGDDGKTVLSPLTKKGDRIRLKSAKWYGEYRDANGDLQKEPLSTNKTAAEQMLAELVRKAELGKAGIADPYEAHHRRPLAEHLMDYQGALAAKGNTAEHVSQTVSAVRRCLDGCKFVFVADLSASRLQTFLADLQAGNAARPADLTRDTYTKREVAELLGVKPSAVPPLIRRHRLPAEGKG
jgi:hypothetical protein